jgi:hypothetical protein
VLIDFTVRSSDKTGTSPLNLARNVQATYTDVNGGAATLKPAPTNASNDPVDGVFRIVGSTVPANSNNVNGNSGSTILVPVDMEGGGGGDFIDNNSEDPALTSNPTPFPLVSVVSGATANGDVGSMDQATAANNVDFADFAMQSMVQVISLWPTTAR